MTSTRTRSRHSFPVIAAIGVALIITSASCGGAQGGSHDQVSTGSDQGSADVIQLAPVRADAPKHPTVLAAANDVVYLGGVTRSGAATWTPSPSALAFDTNSNEWQELPDAPFSPALINAGAVWTGEEIVTVGQPCERSTLEENAAPCEPKGLNAGVLSISERKWRTLEVPEPVTSSAVNVDADYFVSGLGWTGKEALFAVAHGQSAAPSYWLLDPAEGTWRSVPAPDAGAEATCFQDRAWFAARSGTLDTKTGISNLGRGPSVPTITTWKLETDGDPRWTELPSTKKPDLEGVHSDLLVCYGSQLTYTPSADGPTGNNRLWFDATTGSWQALPALLGQDAMPPTAEVGGYHVAWPTTGDAFHVLPPSAQNWSRVARPADIGLSPSTLGPVGDKVFVNVVGEESVNQLILIDPAAVTK